MNFYQKSELETLKELNTSIEWLSEKEAEQRILSNWKNEITSEKKISALKIFVNQFKSALILILIGATIVSAVIWEVVDAVVIVAIVILNSVFGFIQEYKAEKAIESLKSMINPHATVIRWWKTISIDSKLLTIWDILVLNEWDKISADARIIESINLEVAEATLTGESLPVKKQTSKFINELTIWDQKNMVFSGTLVTKGRGKAIVTKIWMSTEIWKIAKMIDSSPDKQTHLQKKLETLSKWLGIVILIVCVIVFASYYYFNKLWLSASFLTAVALAVAAIPEWLPAVVTISLWLWVKRMSQKNALMRKLSSVETLWSVDVICTDKTWTLTQNEMTVKKIFVSDKVIEVWWSGYNAEWKFSETTQDLSKLLEIWVLCNNSDIQDKKAVGDPTEACLLISAQKAWINREDLLKKYKRVDEIPFDSTRKFMSSIICNHWWDYILYTKWATEEIIKRCDYILIDWKIIALTQSEKNRIEKQNVEFAENALRVLWFAYQEIGKNYNPEEKENLEKWLVFVGLQAMIDPPRTEVKDAIKTCEEAWIRVIMITGDNIITAKTIANYLWIRGESISGLEIENFSDEELSIKIKTVSIFARVNPEHKQRIVKILQKQWHIVAMTWDWVNDAPALKLSDIWVAMWITWTDVSKEASDMILTDDNFATIVNAVKEWRWIFDNIKKFVNFLLSTNMWEILVIFIISLMGLPLPLIAIQILWINLVSDGLPALALWVDPIDKKIMKRKPRPAKQWIITKDMIRNIVIIAVLMSLWVIFIFLRHYKQDIEMARTAVFVLMVTIEMVRVQIIRQRYWLSIFTNKRLVWAIFSSLWLVMLVIYTPLNKIFGTKIPSWEIWLEIILTTIVISMIWFIASKILWKHYKDNG